MARVFTVYNCGTNANRDTMGEIVASLAARTGGAENRAWMINDGPGSAPKTKSSQARTPGLHDPATGRKTNAPMFAKLRGTLFGYGWQHNVDHSMEVVRALLAGSDEGPQVINMAGWSRGAITCHMLAHALQNDPATSHLPVNIFGFDPVPGPDNFRFEQISLPTNVRHYTAVVMEDEARKIMKPVTFVDGADDDDNKFKSIPLPGGHTTAVFSIESEVGTIGAALAHKFLTKHGTQIRDPFLLTDAQYCELYARVRLDMATYRGKKGSGVQRKLLGSFQRGVKNSFNDTAYFVNAHHARRFQKAFPGMYRLMSYGAQQAGDVDREASLVKTQAPTTYKSLAEIGII